MDTPSSSSSTSSTVANGAAGNPQKLVERVAQTAHDTVDRVAAAAGPALEKLRTSATGAQETLHSKADQFGAMQEEWVTTARTYVREHPFTAVTIGVLAGMLISRMGRSD
jgi:ElaB/YqjD/DUF883 family membrane-anchored ribosome-binding protein